MLKKASFNCKDNANEWNNKTNNIVFVLGFPNKKIAKKVLRDTWASNT